MKTRTEGRHEQIGVLFMSDGSLVIQISEKALSAIERALIAGKLDKLITGLKSVSAQTNGVKTKLERAKKKTAAKRKAKR